MSKLSEFAANLESYLDQDLYLCGVSFDPEQQGLTITIKGIIGGVPWYDLSRRTGVVELVVEHAEVFAITVNKVYDRARKLHEQVG